MVIDRSFTWKAHIDYLCSKFWQRLYFLRRLRLFGVNQRIMQLFYYAVLGSLLNYWMQTWQSFGPIKITACTSGENCNESYGCKRVLITSINLRIDGY